MNQDEKATAYDSSRKFIGETFDNSTSLSYLQARYMNGTTGRFLSEDPVFLGVPKGQNLENPQSLNSYGYANGNPIVNRDPSGKCIEDACVGEAVMTSPIWGPAVIAGATAVGTSLYYGTEALIRGRNEPRWAGTVPTIDPSEFGLGQSPMGMEDMPKLNPNTPKWTKWTIVTLCGVHIANSLYDLYLEQKSGTTVITNKTEEKSNSTTQNAKNSSSPGKTPSASFVSKTSNNLSTLQTTLNTISTVAIKLSQILSKTK
ncbi:MAG: RHS repeat-associated core domain-containing protein, partial [Candidatus Parcubacteria bacterium]|nr:RHS repeat-associated core domain-containing protein [Candidatus Parcubacteria bacterium]